MTTALECLRIGTCLALAIAGICWRVKHGKANAHRFLFPYIIAAGIAGLLPLAALVMEFFVAWYSDPLYAHVLLYVYGGSDMWLWMVMIGFPILPAAGIVPAVGRRPILMACLGLLSLLTVSI